MYLINEVTFDEITEQFVVSLGEKCDHSFSNNENYRAMSGLEYLQSSKKVIFNLLLVYNIGFCSLYFVNNVC